MAKISARKFADFLLARQRAGDGYIMGATGQSPKTLSSWYYNQYKGAQREQALKWRAQCERVWDCQGLAEGYINDVLRTTINVRAADNYAGWCSPRGTGKIPAQYKVPGAAVFIHNGSRISHVGYLVQPVKDGDPHGDWWVVEARGVMYGVVRTRLSARGWNRWGLMTKYYDYGAAPAEPELGDRLLKVGMSGADVKVLQTELIGLGYSCGKYGADGDFGAATERAVKGLQDDCGLEADGQYGPKTHAALRELLVDDPEDPEPEQPDAPAGGKQVVITGGTVNLRTGPGTQYAKAGTVKAGAKLPMAEADGWHPVVLGGEVLWVSGKYSKVEG